MAFDQSYIGFLLMAVFDEEVLKSIFVDGNASHMTLDAAKLKFIEGRFKWKHGNSKIVLISLFFSDVFAERVGGDIKRKSSFIKHVNKKLKNLR